MKIFPLCPKCKKALSPIDRSAKCENGHSYDFAKEGYLNLLLGAGGTHGDNREMLLARRAFLEAGHYAPLCRAVADGVARYVPKSGGLLDIGCGEGYYTAAMCAAVPLGTVCALDISKEAVRLAAKRKCSMHLTVASAYELPYPDAAFDMVTNLFSPLALDEIRRVLKVGGYFLMAIPEREHLYEMKCVLYDEPYKNEPSDTAIDGFTLVSDERLCYPMMLSNRAEIMALFSMTPYAYRTPREGLLRLSACDSLSLGADFRLLIYRYDGEPSGM